MSLSTPQMVMERLEELDRDLAMRMGPYEDAARKHYLAKRDKERLRAREFIKAEGSVAQRNAHADELCAMHGAQEEAEYEALRAVVRTIETRVGIGQSLLRAQGRS